jgi:signal transduction histidine kinase
MSHADRGRFNPQVAETSDGRLWFLPWGGVSVVDPRHLPFNQIPPPVQVEEIIADRKTYWPDSKIGLPPNVHDLEIDYTSLSFVAPEKVLFRYKLEGRDQEWRTGSRRQAFYSDLSPGNYRFRVTATNNSGVWNEAGAVIDFAIAPAYYQTTWFRGLAVTMVVGLVWISHRVRLRILERHKLEISTLNERLMDAQERERIRIAGELHDGVMQEMLSVSMMLGTVKRRVDVDPASAKSTIDKAQEKTIRVGQDLRRLSHDLHPPLLQEAGLPKAVQAYCEQFSTSTGIPISSDADESVQGLSPGAALALFRVLQEALGNAAKYSAAKQIRVSLQRSEMVSLTVSDDGIGFDASRLDRGGLGLIMMRERASQLDGTFEFESAPGRGTTIRVSIPFR